MGRRGRGGGPAQNNGPGVDYASWLMLVPKEKRQEIADYLISADIKEYDDLVNFSVHIMAALMEGRITPVIAQELRAWHELNFTIIAAKNAVDGTPQGAHTDIIAALVHVRNTSNQLREDYFDNTDVIEPLPQREGLRIGEKK